MSLPGEQDHSASESTKIIEPETLNKVQPSVSPTIREQPAATESDESKIASEIAAIGSGVEQGSVQGVVVAGDNNKEDEVWITPSNSGRSPEKKSKELKFGEVSILSNSFSALGN